MSRFISTRIIEGGDLFAVKETDDLTYVLSRVGDNDTPDEEFFLMDLQEFQAAIDLLTESLEHMKVEN
jgi:hypothetical protein